MDSQSNKKILIKSANSDTLFLFSQQRGDYYTISIASNCLTATVSVWNFIGDREFFVDFFDYMAEKWKGWDGEILWNSVEGEIKLSAVSDRLGHIYFTIQLTQNDGADPWQITKTISLEPSQLDAIVTQVKLFFL